MPCEPENSCREVMADNSFSRVQRWSTGFPTANDWDTAGHRLRSVHHCDQVPTDLDMF